MSKRHAAGHYLCVRCHERPAVYIVHGQVRSDGEHELCLQCYRSFLDQLRARSLTAAIS